MIPYSVIPSLRRSILSSFRHHQFQFIIWVTATHTQFKFDIWIYNTKIRVKFEFGHSPMIFDRLMPLEETFSLRSLSLQRYYTFNSNLTYRYDKVMRMSSSIRSWFEKRYVPFNLKIIWNFHFLLIIFPTVVHIQLNFIPLSLIK
jgi:hypothetical protein